MMSLKFYIIILVALLLGLIMLIRLIKKGRLELKYAIVWIALDVGLAIIVIIPGCLQWLASVLGIYDVTNMVFFVGFIFSIILNFSLTMSLSRNSERVRKLTQQIALNEYELKNKKESN